MKDIIFSEHAISRIWERTKLSLTDVRRLFELRNYVPIGVHNQTGHAHRLFYSEPDDDYFVAVEDERAREIITVLNFTYHNAWPISLEAREMAKEMIIKRRAKNQRPIKQ